MPLNNYVCKSCGSDLLVDYEYHQGKDDGPVSKIPLRELSVYCEDRKCGQAGQFGEIAISRRRWQHHRTIAQVVWWECNGVAHKPNIDLPHCSVCYPNWWHVPTCPDCKGRLKTKDKLGSYGFETDYYQCPKCHIKFHVVMP